MPRLGHKRFTAPTLASQPHQHPALLDAGYAERHVPWWAGRTRSYSFPA